MWLAAVAARLAYVTHRLCGHRTVWSRSRADLPPCRGDIICETCDQVLWCRAHDPWQASDVDVAANHRSSTDVGQQPWTLFENLQQILRLTDDCPPGRVGDEMRRGACILTEAGSVHRRYRYRRRMLKAVARIQLRQAHGGSADEAWSPVLLRELTDALSCETRPANRAGRR